ncbi:MAG: penicillin acylase family protein [Gemmatimonadetes bacterium]|nr:penicillin acylase family protein [Gemmatimonadota bacterium]
MKRFAYVLLALVLLLVGAAGAAAWFVRSADPDPSRSHTLAGLSAPVEVWRDSLGVPHLWARDEADLFRAIGFIHAQDRLWQMEMFRRVADGRLAEILGPELLETDRFLRTLGMGRAAAENERILDPESRTLMEAYAAGVNSWILSHRGALPPEFVALRTRPEPWTVRHSLAIGKIMAWDLADWDGPLELQRAVDLVGRELAAALRPDYPEWGVHILGEGDRGNAGPAAETALSQTPLPLSVLNIPLPRVPDRAREMLDAVSAARASNSWVIGGERTRSGKPILANDTHLTLRAPSLWYLVALHGGGIEAAGFTIPGVPLPILGRTTNVAWGFTNAMAADTDFYIERVDTADPSLYLTPEGWQRFEIRAETIQVRGGDPVIHTVRTSRHGPVISDAERRAGDRVLALRWTGHEPSTEFSAMLKMNRARNAAEFLAALREFTSPHQNVVFADTAGTIGYRLVGLIPVRRNGDGRLPVPGWTGDYDWVRYLTPDEHPEVLDPTDGFIVTANNRQVGASYPFLIGRQWAEPFRAQRIREMVEARDGRFTADGVARQQMDVRDAFAVRYLPHALRAAERAGAHGAAETLRSWNMEASTDSHAAALFYTWYEALRRRVGEDEYRGARMYFPRAALNRMLDDGAGAWINDIRTGQTETLDEQAAAAMREAVEEVGMRRWSDLHETRINHSLGSARVLDRTFGINIGPFSKGGSPYTVDVAGYGIRPPFVNTHGASQRHVIDLADPDGVGGFVIPTGQSGIPFSRHYRDQTPLWREGRLWRIPLDRTQAEARAVHRMVLRPD